MPYQHQHQFRNFERRRRPGAFADQWREREEKPHVQGQGSSSQAQSRTGGPISQLQEFVQSNRKFPVAANRPILQWQFDTRMATAITLEFRATVSFLLDGVPHHAAGGWHSSKKAAQRDAAERVLGLLQGPWDAYAANGAGKAIAEELLCAQGAPLSDKLAAFIAKLADKSAGEPLQWHCHRSGDGWQATVEVELFGVVHTLQGDVRPDIAAAREDTACRALWYLQCPGFEDAFEVCGEAIAAETLALPAESDWQREGAERDVVSDSQQRAAEQKTLIMRVQNGLQKLFAKKLPQNTSVWEWSYEYSGGADAAIPYCRARVHLPVVDREFVSEWCRGQKAAQLDVCASVEAFLQTEEALKESDDKEQASKL